MRLRKLTLRHFRNVGFAALEFEGRRQFLVGANGQGKTNLLESAGLLTAVRSFRTTDNKLLIGHGQQVAAVAAKVEHETLGEAQVTIKLRRDGKELWCDQTRVTKLGEFLGRFPTVVFSSQDQLLVRGAPALRRRWLDMTLAAVDADYLRALQVYSRALGARNALLKRGNAGDKELGGFEKSLAPAAAALIARREAALAAIGRRMAEHYARLCGGGGAGDVAGAMPAPPFLAAEAADKAPADFRAAGKSPREEKAGLWYEPNFEEASAELLLARWEAGRERDAQFRTTLVGPHRDDFSFHVRGTAAREFASEGQQRSLVLALRLAQAGWFQERSGVRPVLLADDVLGELDPERRRRFWAAVDPESQVIATGTSLPEADLGEWQLFAVQEGTFEPGPARE
ncbi:MAG TPA: DNA replication and repair protein RecF [Opitutus sp.]|nr:DNA replication and repair protein RecF [Opitutus sp.]